MNYILWAVFGVIVLMSLTFAIFGNINTVSYAIVAVFIIMILMFLFMYLPRSNFYNKIKRFFNYVLIKLFN